MFWLVIYEINNKENNITIYAKKKKEIPDIVQNILQQTVNIKEVKKWKNFPVEGKRK